MDNPHPAKRPRLSTNNSTSTLRKGIHKPFRSPLKQISGNTASPKMKSSALSLKPQMLPCGENNDGSTALESTPPTPTISIDLQQPSHKPAPKPQPLQSYPSLLSKQVSPKQSTDSTEPSIRDLEQSILSTRRHNETISHAISLLDNPSKDDELRALIKKWRAASRLAAEEVFGFARDKVNGMGGMAAWKAREREAEERRNSWGWEQERGRAKVEDGEDEYVEDERDERLEYKEEREEIDEDEGFTMDMMLNSLGIELDVIGFDKVKGIWIPDKGLDSKAEKKASL